MKWVKMKRHKPCAAALAKAYASAKKSPVRIIRRKNNVRMRERDQE
jgi:hypothetical protein